MNIQSLATILSQANIQYAIVDEAVPHISILISESSRNAFKTLAKENKWKRKKEKPKDLYLYGMNRFLYYFVDGIQLRICCQLACRSALNNGWIPLDRQINEHIFEHIRLYNNVYYLGSEDELCYLTAKCVYTEKNFSIESQTRIAACLSSVDENILIPRLKGVFFNFTDQLLQLLTEQKYSDIIASLWHFSAY